MQEIALGKKCIRNSGCFVVVVKSAIRALERILVRENFMRTKGSIIWAEKGLQGKGNRRSSFRDL